MTNMTGNHGHDIIDVYPLSPVQEGIVFHSLLAPSSSVYVSTLCWKLIGEPT